MTPESFMATPITPYSDWFGSSTNHDDYLNAVKTHGIPDHVYQSEHMLALMYNDKIVVCGYDGNEYTHEFVFVTLP